jgi:stearoyl-CoA desaturase (delta-9 desaturase)
VRPVPGSGSIARNRLAERISVAVSAPSDIAPRLGFNWGHFAFLAPVHVTALLAPFCFSWTNVAVVVALHALAGGLGICVGYHRLFTHKSFVASRPLAYGLATLAALALEGGPISWIANHRRHHQYSDQPGDPHDSTRGFWWAHMGWIFVEVPEAELEERKRRYAADIAQDPYFRWLETWYWVFSLPLALGLYLWGGWGMVVWGISVRLVATYHTTYLVNSAAHFWGYQTYRSGDRSRNNWWVALIGYGEGWHNNHHAFPWSARHGLRVWEVDFSYAFIKACQWLGLVSKVHVPTRDRLRALALRGPQAIVKASAQLVPPVPDTKTVEV